VQTFLVANSASMAQFLMKTTMLRGLIKRTAICHWPNVSHYVYYILAQLLDANILKAMNRRSQCLQSNDGQICHMKK